MKRAAYKCLSAICLLIWQLSVSASELAAAGPAFNGKIAFGVEDSIPDWPQTVKAPQDAPSIVVILLDDVGYGATSTFGGRVYTPNLDELAAQGLRYNRFHVSAQCSPTRAALLTGRNDHRVGFGTAGWGGFPGYNGIWPKSAGSIAAVLRSAGYSTAAFGKWHNTPPWEISPTGPFERWPTGLGFEYFYGFMGGADSQWEPSLYRNTTPVDLPKNPRGRYHLTTDLVDDAINWLLTHESLAPDKPYFLYFAPGATHEPHHVDEKWIKKYHGRFNDGWDRLRNETFAKQSARGVIPADTTLTPRPHELPAWDSLSSDQRKLLTRQMEVYAGFLAQTDYEVGRLLTALKNRHNGVNTVIMYIVGDNGASSEGGINGRDDFGDGFIFSSTLQNRLQHLHELGSAVHRNHFSSGWAWATSSPFQWQKLIASHLGGIRNPLVISWPRRIKDRGGLRSQFTHVTDIAATIYEITGSSFPSSMDGAEQLTLDGTSFADSFDDPNAPSHHNVQVFELLGNRAIYKDGWMASARRFVPWGKFPLSDYDAWELYNLDKDFSQAHDLAAQEPQRLEELKKLFDVEAHRNQIYPLGGISVDNIPSLTGTKEKFIYYPGMPRLPTSAAPQFARSHRIIANVVIPERLVEGVIMSYGSRHGGFTLYVQNEHLVYDYNFLGTAHYVIRSRIPITHGRAQFAYEFIPTRASRNDGTSGGGMGRLFIDGKIVGEGEIPHTYGASIGSFDIGRARISPVSSAFSVPFEFSGTLEDITVELN